MAPVVLALNKDPQFQSRVCVTAQHRQMMDEVLSLFDIRPNWDLNMMQPNQDLADLAARILLGVGGVIREERPDIVLVHGDTTTCFAAAFAAFNHRVPIGHIEAGLRTWDLAAPFPEEANRTLVSRLATYNYAPTCQARNNLLAEGISDNRIEVTGNTVIDALFTVRDKISLSGIDRWKSHFGAELTVRLVDPSVRKVLVTSHRRENFGEGLRELVSAVRDLARCDLSWEFLFPVHPNPNVRGPVEEILGDEPNIRLISPQNYEAFVWLMSQSDIILTDSGGIQEEATSLGKPVLIAREKTERTEALQLGCARLVGTSRECIMRAVLEFLAPTSSARSRDTQPNPFGDGSAARRIVEHLSQRRGSIR